MNQFSCRNSNCGIKKAAKMALLCESLFFGIAFVLHCWPPLYMTYIQIRPVLLLVECYMKTVYNKCVSKSCQVKVKSPVKVTIPQDVKLVSAFICIPGGSGGHQHYSAWQSLVDLCLASCVSQHRSCQKSLGKKCVSFQTARVARELNPQGKLHMAHRSKSLT